MISNVILGQNFDPLTGERIQLESDTLFTEEILEQPIPAEADTLMFDPFTGMPVTEPPQMQTEQAILSTEPPTALQFDPVTGAPLGASPVLDACEQARIDAKVGTSPLWYGGGIIYFVGVPAYLLFPPEPDPADLIGYEGLEVFQYENCYTKAANKLRLQRMGIGCGAYVVFLMIMFSSVGY